MLVPERRASTCSVPKRCARCGLLALASWSLAGCSDGAASPRAVCELEDVPAGYEVRIEVAVLEPMGRILEVP